MVLWKLARLETRAMYNSVLVIQRMKKFRAGRMSEADRRQTIALAQEAGAAPTILAETSVCMPGGSNVL
jgi:hypothetical protein